MTLLNPPEIYWSKKWRVAPLMVETQEEKDALDPEEWTADLNITGTYYRNGVSLSISNQDVVTGSRAADVTYQNNTGKTMFVLTSWDLGGRNSVLSFLSDAATPPTTEVSQVGDPSTVNGVILALFCMVLPGNYYQCSITAGTPTLVSWVEYT